VVAAAARLGVLAPRQASEGVEDEAASANREMEVGEVGEARVANLPENGAPLNGLARRDDDAALEQVTVLGLQTVSMSDDEPVPALAVGDRRATRLAGEGVRYLVPDAENAAIGGGKNIHAGSRRCGGKKSEIDAVMSVVARPPAGEVAHLGRRVDVDVVLDKARSAGIAPNWE